MPYSAAPAAFVSLALAPLVVGLAVCSTAVAQTVTVDKETVASAVSDQLAKQVGSPPDSVTCPEDLEGVVGTELRCELVADNATYGLTVTVTSVKARTLISTSRSTTNRNSRNNWPGEASPSAGIRLICRTGLHQPCGALGHKSFTAKSTVAVA
jgi:uncharacterized protein DUF4333